ncbi:MAG: hypothetical protein E7A41_03655 [Bifidobacterium breve]|nr:hypothetical protein [Bifidobacterium breve]
MILDKPLLGKVYEGQTYLTSGMLHEDDGRILLELHMRELDQKMIIWINLTHLASVNKAMGSSPSDLRE